jgi:hypothetical protein
MQDNDIIGGRLLSRYSSETIRVITTKTDFSPKMQDFSPNLFLGV